MAEKLSGRKAQAARNDEVILECARQVFTEDPGAPIAAVAQRAGVGISALYRRYASKEVLLQQLSLDAMRRYTEIAEKALTDSGDPWAAFCNFMHAGVDLGTGGMTVRLAGTFAATEEMLAEAGKAHRAGVALLERVKDSGSIRPEIEVGDISLLFEQLQGIHMGASVRATQLRHRYLTLLLEGLHNVTAPPLPGPAPTWAEIGARYQR